MSFGRAIIIPAIVALGAAGSILASSTASVAAVSVQAAHAQTTSATVRPNMHYHA